MAMVIDASVAFKWFVPEPGSERALLLLDKSEALIGPDLALIEVINAMWVRLRGRDNFAKVTADASAALPRILQLAPSGPLVPRALAMAIQFNHPLYDCLYLALAERETAQLITADESLCRKVDSSPLAGLALGIEAALA